MKTLAIFAGTILLLSACATGEPQWTWQRTEVPGTRDLLAIRIGEPDLGEDLKLCRDYTRDMHGEAVEEGRFGDCMALRGWYPGERSN
jgi:hypothetical protein